MHDIPWCAVPPCRGDVRDLRVLLKIGYLAWKMTIGGRSKDVHHCELRKISYEQRVCCGSPATMNIVRHVSER